MSNFSMTFESPRLLFLLIPILAIVTIPFLIMLRKKKRSAKMIASYVIHMLLATILCFVLAGFSFVETTDKQAVLILADVSDSTKDVRSEIKKHTAQLLDLIDENVPVGVIAFGGENMYELSLDSKTRGFSFEEIISDATDIDSALQYAQKLFPSDKTGRIILLSDGKQTDGDAQSTAQFLASKGIRLDAIYYDTTIYNQNESQISSFYVPSGAYEGDEITLKAEIKTNVANTATVYLYDDRRVIDQITLTLNKGVNTVEFRRTAEEDGMHTYRVVLDAEVDTLEQNNECYGFLEVTGSPHVLIIADSVVNASLVEEVLEREYTVTPVTARKAPKSIVELCNYDEVILSNVNYKDLPAGYDKLLELYVSVYGRSLLAVGGMDTFMFGNMEDTAIEEILPVEFSITKEVEGKTTALMLVMDVSGSMSSGNSAYFSLAKQGAMKCVDGMSEHDYVGLVTFAERAYLNAVPTKTTEANKAELNKKISKLTVKYGTRYKEAIEMACEELKKINADFRHIIFLSDGEPADSGYYDAITKARSEGITLSSIGLGYGSHKLQTMADYGAGRYYKVESAYELPDIMLTESKSVHIDSRFVKKFYPVINKQSPLTENLGTTELPMLEGYLATTLKDDATAYIVSDEGHPIYATRKCGAGTTAVFTSDLISEWSYQWVSTAVGQNIIFGMIKTTVDTMHHDSSISAEIEVRGKTTDVKVDGTGTSAENKLSVTVESIYGVGEYLFTDSGDGFYKTSIPTEKGGIYNIMVIEKDKNGELVDYLKTAVSISYSSEYDVFSEGEQEFLSSLCAYSGGDIHKDIKKLASIEPLSTNIFYSPLVYLAILCAILFISDVALRKLKWRDVKNVWLVAKNSAVYDKLKIDPAIDFLKNKTNSIISKIKTLRKP